MKKKNEYPECEKLAAVAPDSQKIGEFLDWCAECGMWLCTDDEWEESDMQTYVRCSESIESLLARYFKIDMNEVERERCKILARLRGET